LLLSGTGSFFSLLDVPCLVTPPLADIAELPDLLLEATLPPLVLVAVTWPPASEDMEEVVDEDEGESARLQLLSSPSATLPVS
jgi:hypothetical protein